MSPYMLHCCFLYYLWTFDLQFVFGIVKESDLHTKRTGHSEFVDKTSEAAKPISLEAPKNLKEDVDMADAVDASSSDPKEGSA